MNHCVNSHDPDELLLIYEKCLKQLDTLKLTFISEWPEMEMRMNDKKKNISYILKMDKQKLIHYMIK